MQHQAIKAALSTLILECCHKIVVGYLKGRLKYHMILLVQLLQEKEKSLAILFRKKCTRIRLFPNVAVDSQILLPCELGNSKREQEKQSTSK